MKETIQTEEQLLEKLKADSLDNLSDKQQKKLVKLLPKVSQPVAIDIVSQMPQYTQFASSLVNSLADCCKTCIEKADESHKATIVAYMQALSTLQERLHDEGLSKRDKKAISKQIIDLADKIAKEGNKQRQFIEKCFKSCLVAFCSVAAALAVVIRIVTRKE